MGFHSITVLCFGHKSHDVRSDNPLNTEWNYTLKEPPDVKTTTLVNELGGGGLFSLIFVTPDK